MMKAAISWALALLLPVVPAADSDDGYIGYRLDKRGDLESAIYETASTPPGVVVTGDPDVYLNASVRVGYIGIEVDNITAKINVDAQVRNLLRLNAGVDASIARVKLTIENVSAKVELEARLANVVAMVDDVLSSIDLNPIIVTLGEEVGDIINNTLGGAADTIGEDRSAPRSTKRSGQLPTSGYNLEHNVLYSVNDYTGRTHTNRVLGQDGTIYDEFLDNDGTEQGQRRVVGYYARDMRFNGHNRTIEVDGQTKEFELQYVYAPFPEIEITSWVYVDVTGEVTRTQVFAETFGGGTSTLSNDSD